MLKSKEHVEKRHFNFHSPHRPDVSSAADRDLFLASVPIPDSELRAHNGTTAPTPVSLQPVGSAIEVVLQKRSAGFLYATAAAIGQLSSQIQDFLREQVAPIRLASHLAVLVVATIVILVSRMEFPNLELPFNSLPADGLLAESAAAGSHQLMGGSLDDRNPIARVGDAIQRAIVIPFTLLDADNSDALSLDIQSGEAESAVNAAAPKVDRIQEYVVRSGDTVVSIAARYGLQPETIQWANPALESNPDLLRIGDRLVIPPVDGVLHMVAGGDNLSSLAAKYKVSVDQIASYHLNGLESADTPIKKGTQLVIPFGIKPYIPRQVAIYQGPVPSNASRGSGRFVWPVGGAITQRFWSGHRAIDVGARTGAPIKASDSGYVIAARHGWNGGYGTMVMVDHGNGLVSLYAHMNSIYVRPGESVAKGQQLGTVGNTGYSTGPHLHFEIRFQGVPRNPFTYLP